MFREICPKYEMTVPQLPFPHLGESSLHSAGAETKLTLSDQFDSSHGMRIPINACCCVDRTSWSALCQLNFYPHLESNKARSTSKRTGRALPIGANSLLLIHCHLIAIWAHNLQTTYESVEIALGRVLRDSHGEVPI